MKVMGNFKEKIMKIIGITGKAGAGKSTFREYLKEALEFLGHGGFAPVWCCSFSDPIKKAVRQMFSLEHADLHDRVKKEAKLLSFPELNTSPRSLMQTLGTEWGRGIVGTDVWLLLMKKEAESLRKSGAGFLLIDDVRFDNEARWVVEQEGVVIEVERDGIAIADAHVSEKGLTSMPSYIVDNIGDEKALRFAAYSLALEITGYKGYRTPPDPMRVSQTDRCLDDATPAEWDEATRIVMGRSRTARGL